MFAIPEHAAVTVALGFPLTGCLGWTQPGYDAGQSRWNSGADQITPANVDDLVQLWDVTHPGSPWLNSPLSDGGTIYLTTTGGDTPGRATALDAVMGGYAHGFSSACPPNPPPVGGCAPDWSIPYGTASVRDVAALDTDSAIVLDTDNRLTVLDVNDGTVEWSAELGPTEISGIVVAGDSILVKGFVDTAGPTSALLALPRSGCGASTYTPSWTAHLFEGFYSSQIYAESVAAGQVVYAATDNFVETFPVDGCGATTCSPLSTINVGHPVQSMIVDAGRLVVTTSDGHVVAYGLPT